MNQLAVGGAVGARRGTDALNPQRAVVAFACTTVAVGIAQRAVYRFFRRPKEFSLCEEKALGVLQQLFAPCATLCTTFNSRHSLSLLNELFKDELSKVAL